MKCNECNLKIKRNSSKIQCICKNFLHFQCANLPNSILKILENFKEIFKCSICVGLSGTTSLRDTIPVNSREFPPSIFNITSDSDSCSSSSSNTTKNVTYSERTTTHNITLLTVYNEMIKLQKINSKAVEKIKELEDKNKILSKKLDILESNYNKLEQSCLYNNIDISGIPDTKKIKGLKGVENVFTQHSCLLKEILEEVFKGRDLDPLYPTICSDVPSFRRPPQEVICFIIGGVTYEEALAVHHMNNSGYKVILGGTTVHNSASFIKEVLQATFGIPFKNTKSLEKFHVLEEI